MTSSYLGIISRHGLNTLQLENDHLARFFLLHAYRGRHPRLLCCWAILDVAHAEFIQRLIQAGDPDNALLMLNLLSIDLGTLLPEATDDHEPHSTFG